jgi:hypothetical protein
LKAGKKDKGPDPSSREKFLPAHIDIPSLPGWIFTQNHIITFRQRRMVLFQLHPEVEKRS